MLTAAILLGYEYAESDESEVIQWDCMKCRRILDPNPRDFKTHEEFQAWVPTVPAADEWEYWVELRKGNTARMLVAWIITHEKMAEEKGWHKPAKKEETNDR